MPKSRGRRPRPQPQLPRYQSQRQESRKLSWFRKVLTTWWGRSAAIVGSIIAVLTVLTGVVWPILGGPPWPTMPEVHPNNYQGTSVIIPFSVRNRSGIINIDDGRFICGIDMIYAQDTTGHSIMIKNSQFVMGTFSIRAGDSGSFQCDGSELLHTDKNATLKPFGTATEFHTQSDLAVSWFPPNQIQKMCVWLRGEYKVFGFIPWRFTTRIFQWPIRPGVNQWAEDPIMYTGGGPDPFANLKQPDHAFSLGKSPYDDEGNFLPDTMKCEADVKENSTYGLFDGPGRAKLYFEEPWYKWFWEKLWYG